MPKVTINKKNYSKKTGDTIKAFYNNYGWKENSNNQSVDAQQFEDLRECAEDYLIKCRNRINKFLPKKGIHFLDMASGSIQYPEYIEYSKNFTKRHCVDLSQDALQLAEKKIGLHGEYYNKDFFDIEFEENYFDCILSMHTIYHINKDFQEEVVRKLIKYSKVNSPIIIVYSNPNSIMNKYLMRKIKKIFKRNVTNTNDPNLYFHNHPLRWWDRFNDSANVEMYPWRMLSSTYQKYIFPNNIIGKFLFYCLFLFENKFKDFSLKHGQYPLIVLRKK